MNGFGERLTGGLSDSESSREYVLDPYEKKFFTGDESLTRSGGEHWVCRALTVVIGCGRRPPTIRTVTPPSLTNFLPHSYNHMDFINISINFIDK